MDKILTVIVPAYNVEKYLEKTLDSLCNAQQMDDLEIIVVNDGSVDRTGEIAKRYKAEHPDSVIVIDKENGGHGSTINTGVAAAAGTYFKVVDGDDWVDTVQLDQLISDLKRTDADLLLSPFRKIYEDTGETETICLENINGDGIRSFQKDIAQLSQFYCMHAITFKTEVFRKTDLKLTEHCYYVDMEFILYPLDQIATYVYLNHCVYQYRLGRPGQSVSMASKIKNRDMHRKVIREIIENCIEKKPMDRADAVDSYILQKVVILANVQYSVYLSMQPGRDIYRELLEFKAFFEAAIGADNLNGISRIMHVCPALYWIIGFRYRKRYI